MSLQIEEDALREHQLETEVIFQGKLLDVRRDKVSLPDASTSYREYIVHPGAVVVIAILDNGDILFERQFRYPVGRSFLELPAGKIDAGEGIERTAVRELKEETGYTADHWQHLGTMHPCIGYSNERIEVFVARELRQGNGPELDEGEFLEVFPFSRAQVKEAVLAGNLTDAKTLTALYMAELHGIF